MRIEALNDLPEPAAITALGSCCRSPVWSTRLAALRPFHDMTAVLTAGDELLLRLDDAELRSTLANYAPIGQPAAGDPQAGRWSHREEAGIDHDDGELMAALLAGGHRCRERFGSGTAAEQSPTAAEVRQTAGQTFRLNTVRQCTVRQALFIYTPGPSRSDESTASTRRLSSVPAGMFSLVKMAAA
jgi:2-oxo-4-hydroxy-4-carboxy-5-ureidoimidazoline decarboxylase